MSLTPRQLFVIPLFVLHSEVLTHWIDHNGWVCGSQSGVHNTRYLYFPNPLGRSYTTEGSVATDELRYSVVQGPNAGETPSALYGVCLRSCPRSSSELVRDETSCNGTVCDTWEAYKTLRFVNFCFPHISTLELKDNALRDSSSAILNLLRDSFRDLVQCAKPVAVTGIGLPFVVGFSYLVLIRLPGVLFTVVWSSIVALLLSLIGLGALARKNYHDLNSADDDAVDQRSDGFKTFSLYASYICWTVALLFACLVCFARKAIMHAMGVVKEAARATNDMLAVVLLPFGSGLITVLFSAWLFISIFYVVSAGKKKLVDTDQNGRLPMPYHTYDTTDSQVYALWYLFFSYFWTLEFIDATTQLVVATCAATWYFTREKRNIKSCRTVSFGFGHVLLYHAGTAALGSLLLALLRFARTILLCIQKKIRSTMEATGDGCFATFVKRTLSCACCCFQCVLWCLEHCLRFLNKNAYICTAIFGYPFCKAARKAFFLIARNLRRVAALEAVGNVIFFLGKFLIAIICGLTCYAWLAAYYTEETHSILFPTVFALVLAYYVGSAFVNVIDTVADTILICFIADEELFRPDSSYATKRLKKFVRTNSSCRSPSRYIEMEASPVQNALTRA